MDGCGPAEAVGIDVISDRGKNEVLSTYGCYKTLTARNVLAPRVLANEVLMEVIGDEDQVGTSVRQIEEDHLQLCETVKDLKQRRRT